MNRTIVEQIKERLPVNEVIGQYLKLEKSGNAFKAKCPFHNEKTPSFFVSPDRGGYYCFGCNAKGDIFTFVEQFEGLDFRGALKVLAERAGVQLTFDKKADGERDRLFEIMEAAALCFEDQFTKNKEVKEYVKKRGINDATRQEFRIGWAPEGIDRARPPAAGTAPPPPGSRGSTAQTCAHRPRRRGRTRGRGSRPECSLPRP